MPGGRSDRPTGLGVSSILGPPHGDGSHDIPPVPLEITDQEADQAFDFFDVGGKGTLSRADLKARLSVFYKDLPAKEYGLLISGPNFSKQSLRKILSYDTQRTYDPVRDAFAVYDPRGTGFADPAALRRIFEDLGYGKLSDEDVEVIVRCADEDNDGRISLEDFRKLMVCCTSRAGQARGAGARRRSERGSRAGLGEKAR